LIPKGEGFSGEGEINIFLKKIFNLSRLEAREGSIFQLLINEDDHFIPKKKYASFWETSPPLVFKALLIFIKAITEIE